MEIQKESVKWMSSPVRQLPPLRTCIAEIVPMSRHLGGMLALIGDLKSWKRQPPRRLPQSLLPTLQMKMPSK